MSPPRVARESVFLTSEPSSIPTSLISELRLRRGSVFETTESMFTFKFAMFSSSCDTFSVFTATCLISSLIFSVFSATFIIIFVLLRIESRLSATLCINLLVSGIESCFSCILFT